MYRVIIGTEYDRDGNLIEYDSESNPIRELDEQAVSQFGGFTRYRVQGGYRHSNGKVIHEESVVYELACEVNQYPSVYGFAKGAKALLNHE